MRSDQNSLRQVLEKKIMHRKQQKGSLQKHFQGDHSSWVGFYYDGNKRRRSKTLGRCSAMSRHQAMEKLTAIVNQFNEEELDSPKPSRFADFVQVVYLPFCRRKWKASTASTTEQRIRTHLLAAFGEVELAALTRNQLQEFLDRKAAAGLSFSVVAHLRWDLRAILELAVEENLVDRNRANSLYIPRSAARPAKKVLSGEEVKRLLSALDLRERLIVRLAVVAGMRPGEILALKWKHIHENFLSVEQRVYNGVIDTPKTRRSKREVALSPTMVEEIAQWREIARDRGDEGWIFPSESLTTPMSRTNLWQRNLEPRLRPLGLAFGNFQVMRRTHASLGHGAGIDPKVSADQRGHGIGVSLDVYTETDLVQRGEAVAALEKRVLAARGINGINLEAAQIAKLLKDGAGDGVRTHDVQLGKLAFYH